MSEEHQYKITRLVSEQALREIDKWIAKYPADQKQSAVMQALTITQAENGGYLTTNLLDAVAEYLAMPPIAVYEVASFYSMYDLEKVGRHKINVCTNLSCKLKGSDKIMQHLEEELQIKAGETTKDGRFTLRAVECLAACANAPMLQLDNDYHEDLTAEKVNEILGRYK